MLFRMVPKQILNAKEEEDSFRAVLFRMVPKLPLVNILLIMCFRAVLFRMVPKLSQRMEEQL